MSQRDVLAWLKKNPGWHNVKEIMSALGMNEHAVRRKLSVLRKKHELVEVKYDLTKLGWRVPYASYRAKKKKEEGGAQRDPAKRGGGVK